MACSGLPRKVCCNPVSLNFPKCYLPDFFSGSNKQRKSQLPSVLHQICMVCETSMQLVRVVLVTSSICKDKIKFTSM